MRILHCCLAAIYVDNYGYQENILPKMHKLQGHQVAILASTETYINNTTLGYIEPKSYINEDGIPITRIPYKNILPQFIMKKLRMYDGIIKFTTTFEPDIIFLHDCQFLSISDFVTYLKIHPNTKVYVDGHTDFINSAKNWISKTFLHKILYRWCAKKIEPYTQWFYGVLPARVDFINNIYRIPSSKIKLLPLGLDDSIVDFSKKCDVRSKIRLQLDLDENDFVVISGGKIDKRKNIDTLIRAVIEANHSNIKLIVFGTPSAQMEREINNLSNFYCIRNLGWISAEQVYEYFMASDLGFFPGTHSVLWEQAIGIGLPCVFKKWNGIQHIDVGGNCLFINSGNIDEIRETLLRIYQDKELYSKMKKVAERKGKLKFLYSNIARFAIEEN